MKPVSSTPEYKAWQDMRQRCLNPRNHAYARYGGRGITVCEEWSSFQNFFEDMGPRPEGMSLERINNNGNYEPDNCEWATRTEQQRNRCNAGTENHCPHGHARTAENGRFCNGVYRCRVCERLDALIKARIKSGWYEIPGVHICQKPSRNA